MIMHLFIDIIIGVYVKESKVPIQRGRVPSQIDSLQPHRLLRHSKKKYI
jgi:hypothetical protein